MERIESLDGTVIAFDQVGAGAPVILVSGAFCARNADAALAEALAPHLTVFTYDRRGRGDSGDTAPYAVTREVEDLRALVDAAGGRASLLGLSSGAVLAAEAVASGVPVTRLVMWEPPFSLTAEDRERTERYARRLGELLAEDRRDDALALFLTQVGMAEEQIAGMRRSPYWRGGLALAPTLAYDAAVLGDGGLPTDRLARIRVPTLVLAGSRSPAALRAAAAEAASAIPGGRYDVLDGQDHKVAPEALAPVVTAFSGA